MEGVSNTVFNEVLSIVRDAQHGRATVLLIHVASAAGTTPTLLAVELFDTDDPAAVNDGPNTITRVTAIAITGAVGQKILNLQLDRSYVTKGTKGRLGLRLTFTGAAGDTDYDFTVQLYGEQNE